MTKQEAAHTLAELRNAVMALNPNQAMQAVNALFNSSGVVTSSGTQAAIDMSRALVSLRSIFDKMDREGP